MSKRQERVALVTGASSGIGKAAAAALSAEGFRVFGTSRRAISNSASGLPDAAGPSDVAKLAGVEMIRVDVTDDSSVDTAIEEIIRRTGRIDVLVNNAGIGIAGGAEESSIAQAQMLFDTNLFGVIRLIRAVLPHMRERKSGRIINVSSVLGFLPAPYMAIYAASKHALEGYSESLDHELRTSGIRVLLVEPAYTRTSFDQNMIGPDAQLREYDNARRHMATLVVEAMAKADAPEVVGKVIARAATDIRTRMRYPAGPMARKLSFLRRFAPGSLVDSSLRKQMKLDTRTM